MLVNQEILGLEVAVQYAMGMTVQQARVELMCEFLKGKKRISAIGAVLVIYIKATSRARGVQRTRSPRVMARRGYAESQPSTHLDNLWRDGRPVLVACFHVPLEVDVEKLKHQIQFLVCMDDIKKPKAVTLTEGQTLRSARIIARDAGRT
jgi:hypothetical protein